MAASDPLATLTDQLQDNAGQGPCLRCLRWQQLVIIEDLAEDTRWPLFAGRATEMGIRSCLCLPLHASGATGAVNLYAPAPHAFGAAQVARAATFAGYLTSALIIGARQDGLLATIDQLRTSLASRAVIDQAVGIIIAREHCTSSQAVAMLRAESQRRDLKLRDLARQIVTEASGGPSQLPPFEVPAQAARAIPPAPATIGPARNREDRRKAKRAAIPGFLRGKQLPPLNTQPRQ